MNPPYLCLSTFSEGEPHIVVFAGYKWTRRFVVSNCLQMGHNLWTKIHVISQALPEFLFKEELPLDFNVTCTDDPVNLHVTEWKYLS